jgi:hypothetical protein
MDTFMLLLLPLAVLVTALSVALGKLWLSILGAVLSGVVVLLVLVTALGGTV